MMLLTSQPRYSMKSYVDPKTEMKTVQQQIVEAKKSERMH
jgi:hypothetical protein